MSGQSGSSLGNLLRSREPDVNRIIGAFVSAYNNAYSSTRTERWDISKDDWYRFAFIGDRVLNLVMSQALYTRTGTILSRGSMTKILSGLVSNGALDVFLKRNVISVDPLIPSTIDIRKKRGERITGTAFEALIGALYCETGLDDVMFFITSLFDKELRHADAGTNPKGELQDIFNLSGGTWKDHAVSQRTGPPHEPVFTCVLTLDDNRIFKGTGKKEIEAEQNAARAALFAIRKEQH